MRWPVAHPILLAAIFWASAPAVADGQVGFAQIDTVADRGRVIVLYPTVATGSPVEHGPFHAMVVVDAPLARGNGRLVVISHGSGGSAWVHFDLARTLVGAGFVVAVPEHRGDNARDDAHPGPDSWTIRPIEISRAIDTVAADGRFAPSLALDKVGLYGMSAGGHTALSLAGGRWSPALFRDHCEAHLAEDFQTCVGLSSSLKGPLDPLRQWIAIRIIRWRFADETLRVDHDPRIAAIVAAVPVAADFDTASLAHPAVPLGLVTARRDRWLNPRFNGDRVLDACASCTQVADLAEGGHGALLSPLPPGMTGLEGRLLNDPPGFDRPAATTLVDDRVTAFFRDRLLGNADARRAE